MKYSRFLSLNLLVVLIALLAACSPPDDEYSTPARPTVVVLTAAGPYSASFDEPEDWLIGSSIRSQGFVKDGQYILKIEEPDFLAWSHQQRIFADGVYEIDAQLLRGPEASAYGLLLLGSSDLRDFTYCVITGDGRYDIGRCKDGCRKQESLIDGLTVANAILTGDVTNHLRVELDNGQLSFWINGTLVSQINDLDYDAGLAGVIGESSRYGGFQAAFDNLRITEDPS